ncbi:uncharacterized protein LOC106657381 [Trichogramma pretiosum]|uniref:uncharacterized protein LOC106657381 n=1 Tax=Trichogramma pretiosum TaxID=7493 RepID=UPI0006C97D2D|nr:uncharacterized protein LOC106657381 [Trichogramma pretiosum]XP_014234385.1 uncharacterized protein LOC106657381 [Trichogramma pretiosum]
MKMYTSKMSRRLCFLAISLLNIFGASMIEAAPHALPPDVMFRESYGYPKYKEPLVESLKKMMEKKEEKIERDIAELTAEKMEIQAFMDEELEQKDLSQAEDVSVEDGESLPVAEGAYSNGPLHSGKRTSYMALCHFKICNMGRKRQL